MTPAKSTPNNIQKIAAKRGLSFRHFAGHCLLNDLSYDTARAAWQQREKTKGYNPSTQKIIASILKAEVKDVFPV